MRSIAKRRRKTNVPLLLMVLPGAVWFLLFSYLPMLGSVLAFKDFHFSAGGFLKSLIGSKWVGFKNFEYLFKTSDAWLITRNTLVYNFIFIVLSIVIPVCLAILLSFVRNGKAMKFYQTSLFMPYFLSWVVISYFAFAFLNPVGGLFNNVIVKFGGERISWYSEARYWPVIIVTVNAWKNVGYNTVIYLAAIVGIDKTLYEAAMLDGANGPQQVRHITLPHLYPLICILTLMAIGKIFYADFGLFYQVPRNSGPLYPVTNVIDTYVFRGLMYMGDISMSAAASLYQSAVGFVLVLLSNYAVRRINPENSLF